MDQKILNQEILKLGVLDEEVLRFCSKENRKMDQTDTDENVLDVEELNKLINQTLLHKEMLD